MTVRTFEQIRLFNAYSHLYLRQNPVNERTKLGYAIRRVQESKSFANVLWQYNHELDCIRIDNALIDEKTKEVILAEKSNRPYKYDTKGLKKVSEEENDFAKEWDKNEFEISCYYVKELPEDMDEIMKEHLTGFVIE